MHGETGAVVAKAERRVATVEAIKVLASFRGQDVPDDLDPAAALMEELRSTVAQARWLREATAALTAAGDVEQAALPGGGHGTSVAHPYWGLLDATSRRLAQIIAIAGRLGIEERRVRLEEQAIDGVADAILAALDAAGVTGEARASALQAALEALPR